MKHLSIEKTVDAYPGYTPHQREQLFHQERVMEKFRQQIKEAFTPKK